MTKRIFGSLAALSLAGSLSGCGYGVIPPGSVAVRFNGSSGFSEVITQPRGVWTGFYEKLLIYPTSIQTNSFVQNAGEGKLKGDASIKASTREGAVLPVDVTVTYRILGNEASVRQIFDNFGELDLDEIELAHLYNATIVAVNEVSGKKSIFDLISKERTKFGPEVKAILTPMLEEWGFKLDDVQIREVHPPAEITAKIEEQQKFRAELEQVRQEKVTEVTNAQTKIVQAQQKAQETRLLAQQGMDQVKVLKTKRREVFFKKWNGVPPLEGTSPLPPGW